MGLHPQPEIGWDMSTYREFYNGTFRVHEERRCEGPCPFHHPSDHDMVDWPMEWRDLLNLTVRLCPHGFEHPDPDALRSIHGEVVCVDPDCKFRAHFCDGCCHPYIPVDEIVADLIAIVESMK